MKLFKTLRFENGVISDGSKTARSISFCTSVFENGVISGGSQTKC